MDKKQRISLASVTRLIILLIAFCLMLTACGCKHEWKAADCTTPKTCALCNETEGEAEGHAWGDASCEMPKTCATCQKSEGEPLGHTWVDATTDAPKTCSTCKKTEGEKINVDPRFTTAACKDLFGTWEGTVEMDGSLMGIPDFPSTLELLVKTDFSNDGNMKMTASLANKDELTDAIITYYCDTFYAEFSAQGMNKDEANAAMVQAYGMNVEEYSAYIADTIDFSTLLSSLNYKYKYYVADGKLYSGVSWGATFEEDDYTLADGVLTIPGSDEAPMDLVLKKVVY